MRRLMICAVAVALCGLGKVNLVSAQEQLPAPIKTEACAAPCLEKVCIAVPDKKKTTTYVYGCKAKDICLLRCPPFRLGHGHGGCGHGGCEDNCGNCADCGRPRTVNVLLKKKVETECDSVKCVVSHQEAKCAPACPPVGPPDCLPSSAHSVKTALPAATAPVAITPATTVPLTRPISAQPRGLPQAPPTLTIEGAP